MEIKTAVTVDCICPECSHEFTVDTFVFVENSDWDDSHDYKDMIGCRNPPDTKSGGLARKLFLHHSLCSVTYRERGEEIISVGRVDYTG